ncbi:hypothetical protein KCP76_22900 [Salmonella enterica subsp. enterica serovar Weltevreden]|nr:hypothetical protein KCP76_22900 [Salmonella enterica subsp. enterica serovar Weltevreden]
MALSAVIGELYLAVPASAICRKVIITGPHTQPPLWRHTFQYCFMGAAYHRSALASLVPLSSSSVLPLSSHHY